MLEVMDDRKPISLARLARDTAKIVDEISSRGAVYYVSRPGGHSAVLLINEDHFETLRLQLEIARNPKLREEIDQGRRDFAEGRYRTLDEIEKELELDRPAPPRRRGAAKRSARTRRAKGTPRASRPRGRAA